MAAYMCGPNKKPTRSRFEKLNNQTWPKKYREKETQYNETKGAKESPDGKLKIQFGTSLGIDVFFWISFGEIKYDEKKTLNSKD